MEKLEQWEVVQQDIDGRIRAIARQMARLRSDYTMTQSLIERSQEKLAASRKLLGSPRSGFQPPPADDTDFRAEAIKKAEQHVSDAEFHVARQKLLLEHLRSRGFESRKAARLLNVFESALATYKAELSLLR